MDKKSARSEMRRVDPVDPDQSLRVVAGLFTWLSSRLPGTASAYLAMPSEIDVSTLFDRLPGWRWVLPRIEDDRSLTFRDRDVPREVHEYGIEQPVGEGPVIPIPEIDVFLVPGLAFNRSGDRLGRGGGYYDRVLAQRRPDSVPIGIATREWVVESIPVDDHDQRVEWLATEDGVSPCSPTT